MAGWFWFWIKYKRKPGAESIFHIQEGVCDCVDPFPLQADIDSMNALVEHLSVVGAESESGVLDPKGPRRKSMTLDIRAAVSRAEKPVAKVWPLHLPAELLSKVVRCLCC